MNKEQHKVAQEQIVDDKKDQPSDTYQKLPDQQANSGESISTADNTANGKYSKTGLRKEEKNMEEVKGVQPQ